MDERLQFVARRLADGGTLQGVRHFCDIGGFSDFIAADTGGAVMVNLYTDPQEDVNLDIRHIPMAGPVTRRSERTS